MNWQRKGGLGIPNKGVGTPLHCPTPWSHYMRKVTGIFTRWLTECSQDLLVFGKIETLAHICIQ